MASFLVGHSVSEALQIDTEVWWAYVVLGIIFVLAALACWALSDPDYDLKKFGTELGITAAGAVLSGFLGFILGSGWALLAAAVLFVISTVVWFVARKRNNAVVQLENTQAELRESQTAQLRNSVTAHTRNHVGFKGRPGPFRTVR